MYIFTPETVDKFSIHTHSKNIDSAGIAIKYVDDKTVLL